MQFDQYKIGNDSVPTSFLAQRDRQRRLYAMVCSVFAVLFSIRCLQSQSRLICKYFLFLHCFFTFSGYFFVLPFLFFFGQKNICSHGNEKYTTCIGGWSHNQSQCQIGYDGVLCGTCSSEVDIYTVVEESTVDSGVNGTNVNFFFWTILLEKISSFLLLEHF